jgi:RND family efflux transporter MFP subunit
MHRYLIFLIMLISACRKSEPDLERDPATVRKEIPPTEVQTVPVVRGSFEYLIHTTGRIRAATEVAVVSHTAGMVETLHVVNGSRVQKGDLLINLSSARQKLALEEAEVRLRERELAFRDQMLNYPGEDTARYRMAMQNLRITSGLAAAEVAYRIARQDYDHLFIRASVGGIISDLKIKPGTVIRELEELCRIHDPSTLVAVCEVLEEDALKLRKGMKAEITTLKDRSQTMEGVVWEINPRVDEKTRLVSVTVRLQPNSALLPGMHVQATLRVPYERALLVPREAVVIRSGRHVVFTEENGLAKWNYVEVGQENGKEIVIHKGLDEQKRVIVTNNLQLAHDAPVKVINH